MEDVGKIKSVAVKNFITYDLMKYYPGDYLNIIIGPNGTGKSTIVAAIVLGMGGGCKLLSRSKDISDFVKNGKQKANIEIDIIGPDGIVTFHREFSRDNKESFSIDGQAVSNKKYLEKTKEFNIQIDNLCQFLPQDRVQDFTKMNSQELLRNTQNSVCTPETINTFKQLLEQREIQVNFDRIHNENIAKLKEAEDRNDELKTQIDTADARNALLEDIAMCERKMAWLEFNDLRDKMNESKGDLAEINTLVAKKSAEIKPLKDKANELYMVKDAINKKITDATKMSNQHSDELEKSREISEKLERNVKNAKHELDDYISRVKHSQSDIKEGMVLLAAYNQDLSDARAKLCNVGDYSTKLEDVNSKVKESKTKIAQFLNQRSQINALLGEKIKPSIEAAEHRINAITNLSNQRLDKLKTYFEDTYRAYEWINQNRNQFQGEIFNPVMIEVAVKEKKNAKYIENTIPNKDLQSFVCTNKADMTVLLKKLRNEMKLQVNIGFSEASNELEYEPNIPIKELRKYGFHSYLIDLIEGPMPILNMLCRLYGIHNIAVGNDQTYREAGNVPDCIRKFYSTNHRFSVQVSKYSNSKSTNSFEIREQNLMNASIDSYLLATEKQNLGKLKKEMDLQRNKRSQIEAEVNIIESQISDFREELKNLNDIVTAVKYQEEKIRKKQLEIKKLQQDALENNIPAAKVKFQEKINAHLKSFMQTQIAKITALQKYKDCLIESQLNKKKLTIFGASNLQLENDIRAAQDDVRKYVSTQEIIQAKFDQLKMKCNRQQTEAKKLTNNKAPNQEDFPYIKQFNLLANNIMELKNVMDDLHGRINCIQSDINPGIYEEFESRKQFIHQLGTSIKNSQKDAALLEEKITSLHTSWYGAIQDIVQIINTNFSNFMKLMGFVGEVTITHKDVRDYEKYGIDIGVQYRQNEKLQALTRFVQSGGERAVAIATYTMSLQHISKVPFRCVDEINQGMDPKNERKILTMLMDLTCQEGQSQYFFVTPKLLSNLPYNDKMTISVVHNGEHIEHPYLFNTGELE